MNNSKRIWSNLLKINSPVLAAFSALLIVLALPPFPFYFLAFFALIPFIYSFYRDNFHLGFSKGFAFGAVFNLGILYWLAGNQGTTWYFATLSMLGAVLILAVQYGVLGITISLIGKNLGEKAALWSLPILFPALEFLTSRGVLGFTWNSLCYTQAGNILPAQIASVLGCYGISCWILLINVSGFFLIRKIVFRKAYRKSLILLVLFIILPYIYGFFTIRKIEKTEQGAKIATGLIQPNVDPNEKWNTASIRSNIELLYALSDSILSDHDLDLLVWPETAVPAYVRYRRWIRHEIQDYIKHRDVSLLTGVPDFKKTDQDEYLFYNATFLLNPDQNRIQSYNKIRLVPFGEKIPLSNIFESLENLNLGQGNFDAGDSIKLLEVPAKINSDSQRGKNILISSAICYESGFSDLVREGVRKGAQLLVVVTNDAWFGNTSAPYLHAAIARIRAIENRIPVVRAANTGVSMIIDKTGKLLQKCDFAEKCHVSSVVNLREGATFFTNLGYYFNWITVLAASIIIGYALVDQYKNSEKEQIL